MFPRISEAAFGLGGPEVNLGDGAGSFLVSRRRQAPAGASRGQPTAEAVGIAVVVTPQAPAGVTGAFPRGERGMKSGPSDCGTDSIESLE